MKLINGTLFTEICLIFLLAACGPTKQYDWVAQEGCGTIANAMFHYAMARQLHMDIQPMLDSAESGVRGCWAQNGANDCAVQDEAGIKRLRQKITSIYASNLTPDQTGLNVYMDCLKEKGLPIPADTPGAPRD